MYKFQREDFLKTVDDPLFLEGVRWALELTFFPSHINFRGDPSLLKRWKRLDPKSRSKEALDYPLPYLSPCEDPLTYPDDKTLFEDAQTRAELVAQAQDRYQPAWWCYLHHCETLAVFILYPLLKRLYPQQNFWLYSGVYHTVLLNRPLKEYVHFNLTEIEFSRDVGSPLVFDLVGQLLEKDLSWVFAQTLYPGMLKPLSQSIDLLAQTSELLTLPHVEVSTLLTHISQQCEHISEQALGVRSLVDPWEEHRSVLEHQLVEWYYQNYSYQGQDIQPLRDWFKSI